MPYIGQIPAAAALTASDITDGIITNAKLAQDIISAETALGATPADTDEFLVSDAGTLKRMDYSHIKGGGKVLQVVSATDNTERTTTSATFGLNSSTLTVDITPASTSNKIYVVASFNQSTAANDGVFTIFRDSTNLGSATHGLSYCLSQGGYWYGGQTISVFETAPSTSALTYQVRFRAGSGNTITLNEGPALGNITAWEIEG